MNERRPDFELLRDFARRGDQQAFSNVVCRHVDLVYATARRKVDEDGAAEEIAQNVFSALARKAWTFAPDDSLPSWLYRATLFEAKAWLRREIRRRQREQIAAELGTTMNTPDDQAACRALVLLLDEAMLSLREKDRTALLLRFYEARTLREVGISLGIQEDAAQKRVSAALERLSGFFQRRGYRSATVAAATAALQHTARSAPAVMAGSLTHMAANTPAPAIAGLLGWIARVASLTKAQTAVVCVAIVALPVAWKWVDYGRVAAATARAGGQRDSVQAELVTAQAEVERLRAEVARVGVANAAAEQLAAQEAEAARNSAAWLRRVRRLLTGDGNHWPDDSPFVRIPKRTLRTLHLDRSISPPGVLERQERELLGLSPGEREAVEASLRQYFAELDSLIDSRVRETNSATLVWVPNEAVASQAWSVPALGEQSAELGQKLQERLRAELGEDRWPFVEGQIAIHGSDALRRILSLDAAQTGQEVAVWIQPRDGRYSLGIAWSNGSTSFSNSGADLALFLPGGAFPNGIDPSDYIGTRTLPATLKNRIEDWIRQEASHVLGQGGQQ